MRKDLQTQGPRYVVQIGDKIVDYSSDFKLYITTRNTNPDLMPDAVAITTIVNFTTTRAGLSGQLLAATIQHEKPELETKKQELLKTEEDLKLQLAKLEESILEVIYFEIHFFILIGLLMELFNFLRNLQMPKVIFLRIKSFWSL